MLATVAYFKHFFHLHLHRLLYNYSMFSKKSILQILLFLAMVVIMFVTGGELLARAGGAGGISSDFGGDGGDGIIYIIFQIFRIIPFPYNIIVIAIVLVGYYQYRKYERKKSVLNSLPAESFEPPPLTSIKGYQGFIAAYPEFSEADFLAKVKNIFIMLQQSWAQGDLTAIRGYVSDGVYQRFNAQVQMMKMLKQTNTLEEVQVHQAYIDQLETDNGFLVAHVGIRAQIKDSFKSELSSDLNMSSEDPFVEYFTFIKRIGQDTKSFLQGGGCPNCGNALPRHLGELAKCEYCDTILNSGEYDWVLSEITQADDYQISQARGRKVDKVYDTVAKTLSADKDFSLQQIEDKASNGFLQILTADAMNKPINMKRFVTDELYARLSEEMVTHDFVYNRLFINDVTVLAMKEEDNLHKILIQITYSAQRFKVTENSAEIIDPAVYTMRKGIVMSRSINATESKGSLYAHVCPNCGAPVEDTIDSKCSYCDHVLNSPSHEWIIEDFINSSEFDSFTSQAQVAAKSAATNAGLKEKDYALNNILIVFAADGQFTQEEAMMAYEQAQKWGFDQQQVAGFVQQAFSNRLSVKMPESMKERQKVFKMMQKAAEADGNVSESEQALLDDIELRYLSEAA